MKIIKFSCDEKLRKEHCTIDNESEKEKEGEIGKAPVSM